MFENVAFGADPTESELEEFKKLYPTLFQEEMNLQQMISSGSQVNLADLQKQIQEGYLMASQARFESRPKALNEFYTSVLYPRAKEFNQNEQSILIHVFRESVDNPEIASCEDCSPGSKGSFYQRFSDLFRATNILKGKLDEREFQLFQNAVFEIGIGRLSTWYNPKAMFIKLGRWFSGDAASKIKSAAQELVSIQAQLEKLESEYEDKVSYIIFKGSYIDKAQQDRALKEYQEGFFSEKNRLFNRAQELQNLVLELGSAAQHEAILNFLSEAEKIVKKPGLSYTFTADTINKTLSSQGFNSLAAQEAKFTTAPISQAASQSLADQGKNNIKSKFPWLLVIIGAYIATRGE